MSRLLSRANRFLVPCAAINQLHGPAVKFGPLRGGELVRFGPNAASRLAAPCLIGIFIVSSARRLHTRIQGRTSRSNVKPGGRDLEHWFNFSRWPLGSGRSSKPQVHLYFTKGEHPY